MHTYIYIYIYIYKYILTCFLQNYKQDLLVNNESFYIRPLCFNVLIQLEVDLNFCKSTIS